MSNGFLTLEYVILIFIVVVAILAMRRYLTNALSGKWKESADVFGSGRQYQPAVTKLTVTKQ